MLGLEDREKQQYLKELNFMMFFHCHEQFPMGEKNSLISNSPALAEWQISKSRFRSNYFNVSDKSKFLQFMQKNSKTGYLKLSIPIKSAPK